ncbi:MAG: hypothetical protein HONBIEJF_02919 [Fimbriimonadaceae bacterium]|nr:hypothetical protein [Fimbriimonadaceae bacterium]
MWIGIRKSAPSLGGLNPKLARSRHSPQYAILPLMNAKDVLRKAIDDAGFQLSQVFDSLPPGAWTGRTSDDAMTGLETVEHLSEVYIAAKKAANGETHEWGTYHSESPDGPTMLADMHKLRSEAVEACLELDDTQAVDIGLGFLALHDAYHVGQMASLRLKVDPDWNAYSIYPES